jgi:hypothetical protein
MHLKFVFLSLCLIGLVPAAPARAEPISIVSGSMVTGATDSYARLSLRGGGGNRIDSQWPGLSLACQTCVAGGLASPDARFVYDNVPFVWGDPFASGSATIDGVTYPKLFFSGDLTVTGGSFVLPEIVGSDDRLIVFAQPFSFTGTISGYDRLQEGPNEVRPLFATTWTGAGTADVRFLGVSLDGQSHYTYLGTTYDFAEPVPEPATLFLCATGMAVVLRRRYTSRRKRALA